MTRNLFLLLCQILTGQSQLTLRLRDTCSDEIFFGVHKFKPEEPINLIENEENCGSYVLNETTSTEASMKSPFIHFKTQFL